MIHDCDWSGDGESSSGRSGRGELFGVDADELWNFVAGSGDPEDTLLKIEVIVSVPFTLAFCIIYRECNMSQNKNKICCFFSTCIHSINSKNGLKSPFNRLKDHISATHDNLPCWLLKAVAFHSHRCNHPSSQYRLLSRPHYRWLCQSIHPCAHSILSNETTMPKQKRISCVRISTPTQIKYHL